MLIWVVLSVWEQHSLDEDWATHPQHSPWTKNLKENDPELKKTYGAPLLLRAQEDWELSVWEQRSLDEDWATHPHQSPWTGLPGHGELKPQSTILLQLLVDNTLQQQRGTTLLCCTPREEERRAHCTLRTHAGGCARAKVGKRLQHFVTHLLCYLASLLLQRYIRITLFLFYTAILVQPSVNIATLLQYMYSTTLHGRWEAAGVWGAALKTRSPLTLVHCSTNHQSWTCQLIEKARTQFKILWFLDYFVLTVKMICNQLIDTWLWSTKPFLEVNLILTAQIRLIA